MILNQKKNTSTEASFCFNCSKQDISSELKEIKEINELAFKNKLRKRAIGASLFKLSQTKTIRKCLKSDEGFFDKRDNKCQKINRELISSIKEKWPKMRVHLALSSPPIKENRILSDSATWFDSKPSRYISKFNDLSALTEGEKNKAKKIYVEALANVSLDEFSPDEVRKRLYGGKALNRLFSDGKQLSLNDQHRLKKAKSDLHRKAKDSYFQIMSELPVLGYLETGDPSKKDIGKALKEVEDELRDQLKQLEDPEVYVGSLLAFEPLVEEMLLENKAYCLAAEKARLKVSKDEMKGDLWFLGASVLAAVPCFGGGPIMISACVAFGVAIGAKGLHMVSQARDKAFGRALTGSEFETMAEVYEQDKDLFLEKVLLPVGIWGDTAALARVLRRSIGIKGLGGIFKKGAKKGVIDQDATSIVEGVGKTIDTTATRTSHTSLDDVGITKLKHNADTQADVFQVKAKTSEGKEIEFELEIPSDRLERDRRFIEEMIKDGEIEEGEEEAYSLLRSIEELISGMPEESLKGANKISLGELHSMAEEHIRDRAFKEALQAYGRQGNVRGSKLSSIGPENVHVEEIGSHGPHYKKYDVWVKTQKGEKINMELLINNDVADLGKPAFSSSDQIRDMLLSDDLPGYALDTAQRMQFAIGHMPADIFKRLKSITVHHHGDTYAGRVHVGRGENLIPEHAMVVYKSSKITGKFAPKYMFKNYPHFPINKSVVDAWIKVSRRTPSHMELKPMFLPDIRTEEQNLVDVLAHELGHVLHVKRFGTPDPGKKWLRAIRRDGTSVSNYGDTEPAEDFAEAMRVYIQTDGGTKDSQAMKDFANRFEIIDKLMKKNMQERTSLFNKFKKAMERRRVAFVTRSGVLTHVVVENNVHIIPPEEENTASAQEQ